MGAELRDISVVIPAYNEEATIGRTLERLLAYFGRDGENEVIVVDDGSRDDTHGIVQFFADKYPTVKMLASERNRGKGAAVREGVLLSRGRAVVVTDADLVYGVESVPAYLAALEEGADLAVGSRVHPETLFQLHPRHFPYMWQRHVIGRAFIAVVRAVLGLRASDTQCGFKVFRGDAAREIFRRVTMRDFSYDVEVLAIATEWGLRVREMPVNLLYRGGPSSVRLLGSSLKMYLDLLAVRRLRAAGAYARERA